jgi:hypothetical protein
MTLSQLSDSAQQAARDAWYAARKAYYEAAEKAGKVKDAIETQLPRNLRSLKEFLKTSQQGYKFLDENAKSSGDNIRQMVDSLGRRR